MTLSILFTLVLVVESVRVIINASGSTANSKQNKSTRKRWNHEKYINISHIKNIKCSVHRQLFVFGCSILQIASGQLFFSGEP